MTRLKIFVTNPVERPATGEALPCYALEHIESGTGRLLPGVEISAAADDTSVLHACGDVRFGKLRPYLAKSLLMVERGAGSGELLVLRPRRDTMDSKYLHYLTLSGPFVDWATATSYGVKMPRTNWDSLASFECDVPELDEQRSVAAFLDASTTRIDELIAEQERQRGLVGERFHAYLVAVVTLGIRGQPTLASAELGGLPVPTSWEVRRLGSLQCEIQTGPFGSQLHQADYVDDGYPVVNPANLVGGRITPTPGMSVDEQTRGRLSRHELKEGDVVFGRRGEMGRAGLVTAQEAGWLCGTGSLRIRFRTPVFDSSYLKRVLEASIVKQYLEAASVGSTMDNLNTSIVARIPVPVPPLDEQVEISQDIDRQQHQMNLLSAELLRSIELLREHREALIAGAVAGDPHPLRGVA